MAEPTTMQRVVSAVTQGSRTKQTADEIEKRKILEQERQDRLKAEQAADRPVNVPLAQGETQGAQTRGGARLGVTPAGKELIGMRSGVPIYADATDVYGAAKEIIPASLSPSGQAFTQTREEQRAAYQAKQAPMAAAAMTPGKPAQTYWSPESAQRYTSEAARLAALARIGGQPAYDLRRKEAEKFAGERTRNLAGFEAQKNREEQFARGEIQAPKYELVKKPGVRKATSPLRKFF